jgi:hypothetical protein
MLALLILSTIGLLFTTVKVFHIPFSGLFQGGYNPRLDDSTYAFVYVTIAGVALAMLAATSLSVGAGLGASGRRFAHRLMAVAGLVCSWLLLGAIAAPAALPCSRGIVPDPWVWSTAITGTGGKFVWDATRNGGTFIVDRSLTNRPGYLPREGVYVNLCSVATQHAAQFATGLLPLALALTVLPAIAGFVIVRIARTPAMAPVRVP